MKNKAIILLAVLSAVLIFTGCSFDPGEADAEKVVIDLGENLVSANSLTVSATGSIKVMPDVAYVTVGVTTQNEDMQQAQSDNTELMNAVFAALQAAGLSEDDMRTINYSAYPYYDYSDGNGEIYMYEVTNMVELTVADIDKVGEYIDVAIENGANRTNSIEFSLLDETAHYNDALTDAMEKARSKADTIAAAGGYTIIGTLEVTENASYNGGYYAYEAAAMEDSYSGTTPITTDELEVTASITIVYEIE
ncbi:MAG: SIMPL domain-containing protein [Eubacteriales bacterium]|nr:SIMPL domain-containing protein [Eubacteriales bacterium]